MKTPCICPWFGAVAGTILLVGNTWSQSIPPQSNDVLLFRDEFNGRLGPGWSFEREDPTHWRATPAGLEVRVQPGNMWGGANNARNVLVRAVPKPAEIPIEISVTLSNQPTAQWEQANLVWFYDDSNMVKLGQELVTGRLSIVMGREEGDRARTVAIVPLDAYQVELRLQAVQNRVRGQFRTAAWIDWRDIGQCDLPVKGDPKASLQFYNGRTNDEHWVRVNHFCVRQLPATAVDWPRARAQEQWLRSSDSPPPEPPSIALPAGFQLFGRTDVLGLETRASYQQHVFLNRDGSFGWDWERRTSSSPKPISLGVGLMAQTTETGSGTNSIPAVPVSQVKTLVAELNAVTRLEDDHGDHNFALVMPFQPSGRVIIWFDWYGPASDVETLNDGFRAYGYVPSGPDAPGEVQYRLKGFRGTPPQVDLKPFLHDAVQRGLSSQSVLAGVWLGNEIWNGSRGGTLVTKFDVVMNGRRYSSVTDER